MSVLVYTANLTALEDEDFDPPKMVCYDRLFTFPCTADFVSPNPKCSVLRAPATLKAFAGLGMKLRIEKHKAFPWCLKFSPCQ